MMLPGGLWYDGERCRQFAFKRLTGRTELCVMECASESQSLPGRVTAALAAALRQVGGQRPSADLVAGLAVADRQFLVRQLAAWLGADGVWLTVACDRCADDFDFFVEQSTLPLKEAGEGFPFATAELSHGQLRLRVPDGTDQEAVAGLDDGEAVRTLARRCVVEGATESEWSDEDLAAIDAALEAVAPEVTQKVVAECPDCGEMNEVPVDPYLCLRGDGEDLLTEVHLLASTYHWSEGQILSLPRDRRQRYLEKLDCDRGMMP